MKLTVFGGTGKTGRLLIEQALAAGHEVTVLARTPSKLQLADERLHVLQGDALDPNRVEQAVAGADAIISLLGPAKDAPPLSVSRSTENIIRGAQRYSVKRLLIAAGAGVEDPADKPGLFDKLVAAVLKAAALGAYEDMSAAARAVRMSDLDWTVVRIPMLRDAAGSGRLKIGYLGNGVGMRLSRADLAAFMVREASDSAYVHKAPVISS